MLKVAIIGASYLQLPLVQKAKEMGIETHCFAWEEGAVCKEFADYFYPISITDKELILEVCKKNNIDGITSIASDVAVPTICYVAEKMNLIANKYQDSFVATDKYLMRQRFTENGISSPRFIKADGNFSIKELRFPLIIKPTDRSGSRGVQRIEEIKDLDLAVKRAKFESFSKQAIIEEFITGSEVSVETITWQGSHYILAITDKVTTGDPYFVELEHHQPSCLSSDIQKKIRTETIKALNSLNIVFGASHTEFKITAEGQVYAIEVGARMGGDFIGSNLVQLSTGYDFLKGVIEVALGRFDKPILTDNHCSGVYFLCEETKELLTIIQNAAKFEEIVETKITNTTLKTIQCSGDRSGYFIYQAEKRFKI